MAETRLIPITNIERLIYKIRDQRVMLDSDLAFIYKVNTKRLNEQVRRNAERFPADFMFQLTQEEWDSIRSQFATLKGARGTHRKYTPFAFTEHGAVMLANVLRSKRAVQASIHVVRAFIHLREFAITHKELARKIDNMEKKYDVQFKIVFDTIRKLITPPDRKRRKIGFLLKK